MGQRSSAVCCVSVARVTSILLVLLSAGCDSSNTPSASDGRPYAGRSIEIFVGSASKPATDDVAALFEKQTGASVIAHYGGSGQMLSQLRLSRRGDIYFPGSSDFMEIAKREGDVLAGTERIVVYLIPAINVPRDNPKRIESLEDLARPGVRVGIARPDSVCVGLYAVEVLEKAGLTAAVKPNVVTQTESCEKAAQLVALGSVDAVLGWEVFEHWLPDKIRTVRLPPDRVPRIGYISAAVAKHSKDRELAEAFIAFLTGPEAHAIFRKWHYQTAEADARKFATPTTPVGGEWSLPEGWN